MGKIFEQTLHQRWYPNGQGTDEKYLNLIFHLENANENHHWDITILRLFKPKKDQLYKVLLKMLIN